MIQHVISTMLLVCNEVIVAGPQLPVSVEENERVLFIKDNHPGQGPLAGIEAVLSTGLAKAYLIAACDQPLIDDEMLRMLVPENRKMPCFFDVSESGYIQPFPGYYPVSWLSEIRDSLRRNRRALKTLIAESDVVLRPLDAARKNRLLSINTKEDLARLIRKST